MVNGLEKFKMHFQSHLDQFVLIGGTACDLAMRDAGLSFRATKDLDIVLLIEVLRPEFVRAFWEFIRLGNYQIREKASGEKQYYRFTKPMDIEFPAMLELFSRAPIEFVLAEGSKLTPIPMEEEISSLSAILLDEAYYTFLLNGKKEIEGLPILGPLHLMAFKAKAWLDLTERKNRGEAVDQNNIRKHKNDIFRLYPIVDPGDSHNISNAIQSDMEKFLTAMKSESIDLKQMGIRELDLNAVIGEMRKLFSIQ